MFSAVRSLTKFSAAILTTRYSYNKLSLLFDYYKLIFRSVFYHKFSKNKSRLHRAAILGYEIEFDDYGSFINMIEEIFILQVYKCESSTTTPLIVDCGSNIGISVLYFKKIFPRAKVEVFEPDPITFKILKRNIQHNKITSTNLHDIALGDEQRTVSFFRSAKSINSGLRASDGDIESIVVPAESLSRFINEPVFLLKIDVEGAETDIIKDLIQSNKINLVENLVIEFHPALALEGANDFIQKLRSRDFKVTQSKSNDGVHIILKATR
jgi:FkbM family methyltransferase